MHRFSLVTGASGFAGGHLVELLLRQGGSVLGWSNPDGPLPRPSADGRVQWERVDLLDPAGVNASIARHRPEVVFHCAGMAHVAASWSQPELALRVNVLGTHHLLEAIRAARLTCRVLVTGSAMVYEPSLDALAEDHPTRPADPYGVSKLAQEMVAMRATDLPVIVVRPFNHMGPRQAPVFATSSFAKQIAEIEAGSREPILRVGNLDARRDLTDVRDTVRAYAALIERGRPWRPYNVCSGRAHRVGDLLDMLIGLARVRIEARTDPALLRPSDNPVILGDPGRLKSETGWTPAIPIEQSLADLLDYWRSEVRGREASRE